MQNENLKETEALDRKSTRRGFLEWMLGGIAGIGALVWLGSVLTYLRPVVEGSWGVVEVGRIDKFPVGRGVSVPFKGTTVLILHLETGFVAFSAICTHAGCLVDWDAEKEQIVCPCHSGVFDSEGNVISGIPPRSLKRYRINTIGDKVLLAEG